MKTLIYTLGAVLLFAGCAHNRGGTGTSYDTDYGREYSNGPDSDLSSPTNSSNHIEKSRQYDYPLETDPEINDA